MGADGVEIHARQHAGGPVSAPKANDTVDIRVGEHALQVGQAVVVPAGQEPVPSDRCGAVTVRKPRASSDLRPFTRALGNAEWLAGAAIPMVSPGFNAGGFRISMLHEYRFAGNAVNLFARKSGGCRNQLSTRSPSVFLERNDLNKLA